MCDTRIEIPPSFVERDRGSDIGSDPDDDDVRSVAATFAENPPASTGNHNDNEYWSYRIKLLLKNVGEKSIGYRWMHEQEAIYYSNYYDKLKMAEIIMTTFLGTLTGSSMITFMSNLDIESNISTIIVIGVAQFMLTVIMGIIIGIREYGDYYGKSLHHREASYKFLRISHSIQEQLSLRVQDRENDTVFLKKMVKGYDELMMSPLVIRDITANKYMTATKNNNIYKPALIGDVENIDISSDSDHVNIREEPSKAGTDAENRLKYEFERFTRTF